MPFSWVVFASKKERNRINKLLMSDPRRLVFSAQQSVGDVLPNAGNGSHLTPRYECSRAAVHRSKMSNRSRHQLFLCIAGATCAVACSACPPSPSIQDAGARDAQASLDGGEQDSPPLLNGDGGPRIEEGQIAAVLVFQQDIGGARGGLLCDALALLTTAGELVPLDASDLVEIDNRDSRIAMPAESADCPPYGSPVYRRSAGFIGLDSGVTSAIVRVTHGAETVSVGVRISVNANFTAVGNGEEILVQEGGRVESSAVWLREARTPTGEWAFDLSMPVMRWISVESTDPRIATVRAHGTSVAVSGVSRGTAMVRVTYRPPAPLRESSSQALIRVVRGEWQRDAVVMLAPEGQVTFDEVGPGMCLRARLEGTYRDVTADVNYRSELPDVTWAPTPDGGDWSRTEPGLFCITGEGSFALQGCSMGVCGQAGVLSVAASRRPSVLTATPMAGLVARRSVVGGRVAFCPEVRIAVAPRTGTPIDVTTNPSLGLGLAVGDPPPYFLIRMFDGVGAVVTDSAGNPCFQLTGGGLPAGSEAAARLSASFGLLSVGPLPITLLF